MESIDKWSWDNWVTIWQKKKFGTTDHTKHQVEFKYIKDLNVKKRIHTSTNNTVYLNLTHASQQADGKFSDRGSLYSIILNGNNNNTIGPSKTSS